MSVSIFTLKKEEMNCISGKYYQMMHPRIILLMALLLAGFGKAAAQGVIQPRIINNDYKGIIYNREFLADLRLHTNGYALSFEIGKIRTYYRTEFYNIGFGELKHPKEYRQSTDYINPINNQPSRSFIFGKQNNCFALRAGYGVKRYYSEKARRNGLAVGATYEGGFTLGILKPYYLQFTRVIENQNTEVVEKYSEENKDAFLNIDVIHGSGGFSKGLSELSLMPGLHGQAALHFDWGAFDEFVKALEVGMMVDVFFKKVPIMASEENKIFFLNFYISLQIGKRW